MSGIIGGITDGILKGMDKQVRLRRGPEPLLPAEYYRLPSSRTLTMERFLDHHCPYCGSRHRWGDVAATCPNCGAPRE